MYNEARTNEQAKTQSEKILDIVRDINPNDTDRLFQALFPPVPRSGSDTDSDADVLTDAEERKKNFKTRLLRFNFGFKVLASLMQASQWGLLAVSVAQLPDDKSANAPDWLKSLIKPAMILPAAVLMNIIVTWYLVDLENIVELYSPYQAIFLENKSQKPQASARPKMAVTLLLGMAFAVAGAALFLPVVTEPEELSNSSLPNLVAYYRFLENNEVASTINLATFWLVNIIIQATSGLSLAESLIDFSVNYFSKPGKRERSRIHNKLKEIARTANLNGFMKVLRRNYISAKNAADSQIDTESVGSELERQTEGFGLEDFLKRVDEKAYFSWLLIAATYEEYKQSGVAHGLLGFLRINLTLIMNYGFISFDLAALRTLPLYVALPAILVTVVLTDGLSKYIVQSIKSSLSNSIRSKDHWSVALPTVLMSVFSFLLVGYTGLVALPKTFDEELANCALMNNETQGTTQQPIENNMTGCSEDSKTWFYAQLVLGVLTIDIFNSAPVIEIIKKIKGCIVERVAEGDEEQAEELLWKKFEADKLRKLEEFSRAAIHIDTVISTFLMKKGELNSLFLLSISQGHWVPVRDEEDTLRKALCGSMTSAWDRPSGSHFFAGGDSGNMYARSFGDLIPLTERSTGWRIGSDIVSVSFLAAAFTYSILAYDKNDANPMHRLLDLINFLQKEIAIPLTLLWLGHIIPRTILAVRACRENAVSYWDPSKKFCGALSGDIKMVRSSVSTVSGETVSSILSALILLPQMFSMYHTMSTALAANIELDLKDFDEDSREITESFFEFFVLAAILAGANHLGTQLQSAFSTARCAKKIESGDPRFIALIGKRNKARRSTTYGTNSRTAAFLGK